MKLYRLQQLEPSRVLPTQKFVGISYHAWILKGKVCHARSWPDIPAVFDNTLIAAVLSAALFSSSCWLVTTITRTDALADRINTHFALLGSKKLDLSMTESSPLIFYELS